MVEEYQYRFGTTSNPKFRVLKAIYILDNPSKSEIEEELRDSSMEDSKLLSSNIRTIVNRSIDSLMEDELIIRYDENPPTYKVTTAGADILVRE